LSYIQRSLGDGEQVVMLARFHWLYNLRAWLALIVPLLLLAAALVYADEMVREGLAIFAVALVVVGIVAFFTMMIHKWTTEIGITSHRLVKKTGFISLKTAEVALPNIEGVRVTQSLWGRLFGYGRIRVEGTGDDHIDIPDIDDPVGFRRAIETAKGMNGPERT
jgi:uncharacterized membrane protein YdbT with pleckstrin-like domain